MCKYKKNNSEYRGFGPGSFWLLLALVAIIVLSQNAHASVVIGNDTSFTLNDTDGSFRLIKFESIPEATTLQDSSPNGEYMWRITAKSFGGTEYEVLPVYGGVLSVEYSNPSETKYNIDWTALAINDAPGVLDVKVSIRVPVNSALTYWSIDVTNRSTTYGVWTVEFPKLTELGPIGAAEDDVFLDPLVLGHATVDPSQNLAPRYTKYPGYASFQMQAFYDEAAAGAYLAAYDGNGYYKHFDCDVDAGLDLVKMWITNFPEGQGIVTTDYQMPYEVVIGTFKGDWHDAAAIYREWAVNQIWCQNGKIDVRADIPDWYKELPMWEFITSLQYGHMKNWSSDVWGMGIGYANHWNYMWRQDPNSTGMGGDYTPDLFPPIGYPDDFITNVNDVQTAGVSLIPYLYGSAIDIRTSLYTSWGASSYAAKYADGNPIRWGTNHEWMCPYQDFWPDHIADVSEDIVNYGVNGVYYDTTSGNSYQCFDPTHGHPVGGGNYWFTGNRKLFSRSRTKIRAVDPNAIMTSENPCEAYIDVVDGFLQFTGITPNYVPAFQAIYHDYMNLYGNSLATSKVPYSYAAPMTVESYEDYPMALPLGLSFIQGDQLGWTAIWNVLNNLAAPVPPNYYPWDDFSGEFAMWRKMAHFRKKAANKYLGLGQMVKPPVLQGTLPVVSGNWGRWGTSEDMIKPAVLHSAWKSSDDKLGVVLLNISATPKTVSYQFDSNDYWGVTADVDSYLLDLNASEEFVRTFHEGFAGGSVHVEKTLQPLEFWMLEFGCPAGPRRWDAPGKVVIEDGRGSSAGGEWTCNTPYALRVTMDGGPGDVWHHNWNPHLGEYTAYPPGYATFWHEGAADNSWQNAAYNRVGFADELDQDLSAYMDGSVKLRVRTNSNVLANYSAARVNNIIFIFRGLVGGVTKTATFQLYCDPFEPPSVRGWDPYVMHDIEVNLEGGLFTKTGSTYPSGTHDSLVTMQYATVDSGNALEFWQNITDMGMNFQVCSQAAVSTQIDGWVDIEYIEIVAETPTNCDEALAQGYTIEYDLNNDCKVNFEDLSVIADEWHSCITPGVAGCDQPWLP